MATAKILLFAGGKSAEREISIKSGKAVSGALSRLGLSYSPADPAEPGCLASVAENPPDVAFIAMHGAGGEDGRLQGFLDLLGVPYTGSGAWASALCMDKIQTKWAFQALGVPTAPFAFVGPNDDLAGLPKAPWAVKPRAEGSSIGVKRIETVNELKTYLNEMGAPALVESWIAGRELTVPVVGEPLQALPVIEIRPKQGFFDYKSKYTKGATEYICPADLPAAALKKIHEHASRITAGFGLRDMARIDVMLDGRDEPWFLEVNTIPGMTETSLLPMAAKAEGIEFDALIGEMVGRALGRAA